MSIFSFRPPSNFYYCSPLPSCCDMLNPAVADLIELFDEEGAFIFGTDQVHA
jgi:hypothetical protein